MAGNNLKSRQENVTKCLTFSFVMATVFVTEKFVFAVLNAKTKKEKRVKAKV